MRKVDNMRFIVVQARLHPYYLAGAHKFMTEKGIVARNTSELLHLLTEIVTMFFEQENGQLFEDNEAAADYCAHNKLSLTTRAIETNRVRSYQSAMHTLKQDKLPKAINAIEAAKDAMLDKLLAEGMSPMDALDKVNETFST